VIAFAAERRRVQRELAALGISPQRAAGQHFLLDRSLVRDAVAAAAVGKRDTVLEVGPGLGILTEALVRAAARVTAVEVERHFAIFLKSKFRAERSFTLIRANLFDVDLAAYVQDRAYAVVSNLPYSITGLALRNFLTVPPRPDRMVLLLQREVAERVSAKPGALSILGVLAQATADVRIVRTVPPEVFWPEPAVESALVKFELYPATLEERLGVPERLFFRVVRMGFAGRRKQIKNSLAAGLAAPAGEIARALVESGIPPTARPQEISVTAWAELVRIITQKHFDITEKK
jgi:16S rRNA (adenine1518-N6/adenine1519-N6)-dimethyltransferase